MYEDIHFEDNMKDKLIYSQDNSDTLEFNSFQWMVTNGAILAYSESYVYYCLIDSKNDKVKSLQQVDFKIDTEQMRVSYIHKCRDRNLLVIILSNNDYKFLTLVWDLITNTEKHNYSSDSYNKHFSGANSASGYLLMNDFYVNLDTGLANYFYE